MSVIEIFDIRTLLVCQALLALIFSTVFFAMRWAYRSLNGVGTLACGFLLGVPGILLVSMRSTIPYFISAVVANGIILSAYLLLYVGIRRFYKTRACRLPRSERLYYAACGSVVIAVVLLTWFTVVNDSVVLRIMIVSATVGSICLLCAIELLQRANKRVSLKLFGSFMAIHSITDFYRLGRTALDGVPTDFMQDDSVQVLSLIVGVLGLCLLGIFFLVMVGGELTLHVEHRANQDLLTGTLNRQGIEERLSREIERARRNHHAVSAVLIDLDHFKAINDSAGHAAGDKALRTVAQAIFGGLRSYDVLGRYGGDEFLLLLPETVAADALEIINRVRGLLADSIQSLGPALHPTISVGLSELAPQDTIATLLGRADAALYDAKRAGRNCVRYRPVYGIHLTTRIGPGSATELTASCEAAPVSAQL